MEETMRASDAIKAARSYVVTQTFKKGLFVMESHWAPGYTPAHCSTPIEAIDFAIREAEEKMTAAQAKVVELHDLRATMMAGGEAEPRDESVDHGGWKDR